MQSKRIAVLTALLVALLAGAAVADVPQNMNVQGRLTDASGDPVPAGLKNLTFKIYDAEVAGSEIWPGGPGETQAVATDANGLWNARVGALIPLTDDVFEDSTRWLEVTVDDGVNPPETMPRIKLNKTPYTSDVYVNETGDVMTGPLFNLWTQENVGSNIDVQNNNDGYTGYWTDFQGTWGIQSEAQSDDALWNIGVAGAAQGNNSVLANYGLYGAARGTGTDNIGVYGETGMNGIANYSGYFANGDFVVLQPFSTGTDGVQLPVNTISDAEILDEAGVAAGPENAAIIGITTVETSIASATATFPDRGFVVVICEASFSAVTASTYLTGRIYENGVLQDFWWWDAGDVDAWYDQRQTKVYTDSVTAGTYTYDLRVLQSSGTASAAERKVTILYFPTAYGTVSSPVAATGGSRIPSTAADGQPVLVDEKVDVEAERAASLAANQARIENEMAVMRAKISELEARLGSVGVSPIRSDGEEK